MNYIPYLVIFIGVLMLIFFILTKYNKDKQLDTVFINKTKYMNSMMNLFLISGSALLILGLLSLIKVLPINILIAIFLPWINILYFIKMISITNKYGPTRK